MSESPLLEAWQVHGVIRHLRLILAKAHDGGHSSPFPPLAEMVTTYGPPDAPRCEVAYGGAIRVCVTVSTGHTTPMGFWELWTLLWHQPQLLQAVEPLTPALTFYLYVHDRLLAWDLRSLVCAMAGDHAAHQDLLHVLGVFTCAPHPAVLARRREAFYARPVEERAQVLRDAVTSDVMEPGRQRVPLRGLLHAGGHRFETGETLDPFRVSRYLDAALGLGRRAATPVSALAPADQARYAAAPAPHLDDDSEDLIQHATALLPPKERAAVRHYWQAAHLGADLKAYCADHELDYDAVQKAAKRGLARLSTPT
jgi:hypothetical protein